MDGTSLQIITANGDGTLSISSEEELDLTRLEIENESADGILPMTSDEELKGRPLHIVTTNSDGTFSINCLEQLKDLLFQPDMADRKVVVVSVVGAFRQGKSFLLNFFLRYLHCKYKLNKDDGYNWMGNSNAKLEGFSWCGGPDRHTTGILMWSEIFKTTLDNGDKVAIILLDTQGVFDTKSTLKQNVAIFALTTMLSSAQIYNVVGNIGEDNLQHLQLFSEYGRLALKNNEQIIPFQDLHFLVRDWFHSSYGKPFGAEGGQIFLNERLSTTGIADSEMITLREHIRSCFNRISCFLMPHPGLNVGCANFDGQLTELNEDFKHHLRIYVPSLLAPSNLVTKNLHGQPVTCATFLDLLQAYMHIFNGHSLPTATSIFNATVKATNMTASNKATDFYVLKMYRVAENARPVPDEELSKLHIRIKQECLQMFDKDPKIGGEEYSRHYKIRLADELDNIFRSYKTINDKKIELARQNLIISVSTGALTLAGAYAMMRRYRLNIEIQI